MQAQLEILIDEIKFQADLLEVKYIENFELLPNSTSSRYRKILEDHKITFHNEKPLLEIEALFNLYDILIIKNAPDLYKDYVEKYNQFLKMV